MISSQRYDQRGVSASKEDVHNAIKNIDKGLYPQAFCKIIPDIIAGDAGYCNIMHADGAGTKSSLAYTYWKETGDISVWRGIAQDAIIMNIDDLLCVGAIDNILLSSTIGRNKNLAAEGKIFTREHDRNLLLLIPPAGLIEKTSPVLDINASFTDLVDIVKKSNRNIIAVADRGELAGVIYLDDLRPVLFNPELLSQANLAAYLKIPNAIIADDEDMISIANKFDETSTWVLPVVDSQNHFKGFISKSAVLNRYRELLKEQSS